MPYQPLTREQYQSAISAGFTHQQIVDKELERKNSSNVQTPKKQTGILQKATSVANAVFPGQQVGEAIGTLGGYGITAAKERLGLAPKGTTAAYDLSAPSPLRVGADVVAGGLSVAGFKGVGTTGNFLSRVLTTFGIGAGLGASQTIAKGGTAKEALKSATITGGVAAAIPVVGAGLRAAGRQFNTLPDRFLNSALGRSKAQILKDPSGLNKYVLDTKPIGTARQLAADASVAINKIDDAVNSKISNTVRQSGFPVTIGMDNFLDDVAKTPGAQGALMRRADIKEVIESLAPQTKQLLQKKSLTLEEANKLRSMIDRTLGDRAFIGGQLSNNKQILKDVANNLRELVKTKAPPEVRGLFNEYSKEIKLRDALLNVIAQKSRNQVLSIGDIFGGGIGGILGGGVPGAAAGIAVRRTIESVPFKIAAAKLTSAVSKVGPIIDQMTPAQQTAILILIADLVSPDENDRE